MPPHMEKNFTQSRPCMWCLRAVKWFPVLFILSVIIWSYYAYVVQLCFITITSTVERIVYFSLYHVSLVLFLWAYWQTVFTKIGTVPRQFRIPPTEVEQLIDARNDEAKMQILRIFAQNLPVSNRTAFKAIRFCETCLIVKPDRAHHCHVCGKCVLKMDHHCPWVNNCVSFTNYKFFILFLGYALIYCIFIALTTLEYFILFWKGELEGIGRFHILFLFFVSLMFALSLMSLFGFHIYLVVHNRSTLESFRPPIFLTGPDKNGFSLGKYNNIQEVFGDEKRLWFLPIFSSLGDGVVFPMRAQHHSSLYNSMDSTQNSLGDGVTFPQRCVDEDTDTLLGGCQRWIDPESGYGDQLTTDSSIPDVAIMQ